MLLPGSGKLVVVLSSGAVTGSVVAIPAVGSSGLVVLATGAGEVVAFPGVLTDELVAFTSGVVDELEMLSCVDKSRDVTSPRRVVNRAEVVSLFGNAVLVFPDGILVAVGHK